MESVKIGDGHYRVGTGQYRAVIHDDMVGFKELFYYDGFDTAVEALKFAENKSKQLCVKSSFWATPIIKMESIMESKVRINTTRSSPQGEEYRYVQISLPNELRVAANLRPEDKLSFRVVGSQVRIKYDIEGYLYKSGVVSVNQKYFKHPVNLSLGFELVDITIEGDELVVNVPDSAFSIIRGFDSINKGFAGVQA